MPRPKLIQFSNNDAPKVTEEPEPEVFNKKPAEPKKFVPPQQDLQPQQDLEVKVPDNEEEMRKSMINKLEEYVDAPEPPPPPQKRQISERQRQHLKNLHASRKKKTAEARATTVNPPPSQVQPERPTTNMGNEDAEFERWVHNFEKFDKVMTFRQEKERKRLEEEAKKEAELEAKIRKKIKDEELQRRGQQTQQTQQTTNAPTILQQPTENRFGKYGNFFGY